MKREEAINAMKQFVTKYAGQTVVFYKLNDDEKFIYVMIKSFNYFKFLGKYDRLTRAIQNAEAHKHTDYTNFGIYTGASEAMFIAKE